MNHKLPFILAIGMMIAAVGLYSWDRNMDANASVEQTAPPVIPEWKPRVKEFTLDDGTRCVSVSTRATNFPNSSGFSGISCDWEHNNLN